MKKRSIIKNVLSLLIVVAHLSVSVSVIKVHAICLVNSNGEEECELLDFAVNETGTLTVKSDKFSDLILRTVQDDEGLSEVSNLQWIAESSATLTWDAVEGADYYAITVEVYDLDGTTLIGSVETGTSAHEIDVQQEVNNVVKGGYYELVKVVAKVSSQKKYEGNIIAQSKGSKSSVLVYKPWMLKLPPVINVTISDDYCIEFNHSIMNPELAVKETVIDITFEKEGDRKHLRTALYTPVWGEGKGYIESIKDEIEYAYEDYGLAGDVEFAVSIQLIGNKDKGYDDSDYSGVSNVVYFRKDKITELSKLPAVTDIILSEDYSVEFNHSIINPEIAVKETVIDITFEKEGDRKHLRTALYTPVWEEGTGYLESIKDEIEYAYEDYGLAGDVEFAVSIQLIGNKDKGYDDSDYSEVSNAVNFRKDKITELSKLPAVTGIILSEDYSVEFNHSIMNPEIAVKETVIDIAFEKEGDRKHLRTALYTPVWEEGKGYIESIKDEIEYAYEDFGLSGIVDFSISIELVGNKENGYDDSDYSEYSNLVEFSKGIISILISPSNPIVYIGHSYYLGKSIIPKDEYYKAIEWESDNPNIVSVDKLGKITGNEIGKATITAKVDRVSDTVTISVYDISSNVEDDIENQQITGTAGSIIDDIVNTDTPNLEGTDIHPKEVEDIKEKITDGIENGNTFHTDVVFIKQTFEKYKNNWGQIQKAAQSLNAQFVGAYNIEVEMYHKDKNDISYHIGNITELENEITFTIDLVGNSKKYVLVRVHKNSNGEDEYESLDFNINEDGSLTVKSDKFSDFVILTIDEASLYKLGDVDGDGVINAKDVTMLRRHLAGGWGVTVNLANADVNGDGTVDAKDVTILRRFLAGGWGVKL